MRLVVASTLPHFLCLPFILQRCMLGWPWAIYATVVGASSCASVVWHHHGEPRGPLFWLDYSLAGAWTATDLLLAYEGGLHMFLTVAYLNLITVAANKLSDWMAEKGVVSYEVGHTMWHIVSSTKSILVAYLLSSAAAAPPL